MITAHGNRPRAVTLGADSRRPDRCILPQPDRLKGGAAQKVVGALIAKGRGRVYRIDG